MTRLISKLTEILGKYTGGTFLERKGIRRRSSAGRSINDVVTISDEARRRYGEGFQRHRTDGDGDDVDGQHDRNRS